MESLVLRCNAGDAFTVLAPYERKGYEVTGLKTRGGGAVIALRASAEAVAAGRAMATKLLPTLPSGAKLLASCDQPQALEWLNEAFGAPTLQVSKEVVQWEPEEDDAWWRVGSEGELLGSHDGLRERFRLDELLAPGTVGSEASQRFCHQLRRDSYVPVVIPGSLRRNFETVETAASEWFALSDDDKNAQGGAYGHVDRKFTGYRAGKFREQLEVRQTLDGGHGGIYPRPETPGHFGGELRGLLQSLDGIARGLLRHIAVDVGADDGFFDGLLDPPPPAPAPAAKAGKAKGGANGKASTKENGGTVNGASGDGAANDAPPVLGHSLMRLCRYDPEDEGVYGSNVLCEAHNDVGFLTLDACASVAGLEALRRADGMWVPVEEAPPAGKDEVVVLVMVGDTLSRLTANYYAACKHRVVQPPEGMERIGLPFLFRGRSDAVLNTKPTRERCAAEGRVAHLAEMETTTIKELPAFDSAKSILRGWFRSVKT